MKVLAPITVTEAVLVDSSLAEDDYSAWSSGPTYALADRVIKAHKVWESAQASNNNHDPETDDGTWWLEVGPTNRWAMFDGAVSTASTSDADIEVTLMPSAIVNALACIAAIGDTVRVQMFDGADSVYDVTQSLDSTPIVDWDDYFFADQVLAGELLFTGLPRYYAAAIVVTISAAASSAAIGALAVGVLHDLGGTGSGASAGITDYSRKSTDDFGTTTLLQRSYAKRSSQRMLLETDELRRVQALLAGLRAVPCVWVGAADTNRFAPLVIFGWFKAFSLDITGPSISYCTLEIEGLT